MSKPIVELELVWDCPKCKLYNAPDVRECVCCGLIVEIKKNDAGAFEFLKDEPDLYSEDDILNEEYTSADTSTEETIK